MKEVFYTARFIREAQRVPLFLRPLVKEREEIFKIDPFHYIWKTHKLKGALKHFWAFSINHHYRIIFKFADNSVVVFHSIGDHSIYD